MIRVFLFLISLLTASVHAQTVNQKIDKMVQKHVDLHQFSGTVLLAKEGKVLYAKAFGDANKSYQVKNTIDTKFNTASMGKMFTGVSIMQLHEQGKLDIHAPVSNYLNDFPLGDKITVYHLLSHTGGIGSYMRHPSYRANRNGYKTISDLLPLIYEQKLVFEEPGSRFAYSNSGMVLLGAIIEKVSKQSYASYLDQNILGPSGMKNTSMQFADDVVSNRATGYIRTINGDFQNNSFLSSSPFSDGGILSTVEDMLKFDQALYGTALLNEASKKMMFTALKVTYGLAFQVETRQDNLVVGHSGGMPGFSSYFSRYLKDKYTIIALSNYDMIARNIVHYIESIIYNKPYTLPKERLRYFIVKHRKKLEKLNNFKEMASFITKSNYAIRHPQRLNRIAYAFLQDQDVNFAIHLFKLNVHLFPKEANMYDSLGEAYEKNKQFQLALKNYRKAVSIAQKNKHASLESFQTTLSKFEEKMRNNKKARP